MADNPFTPIPLGPYNPNPPPNDGTQVPENVVDWETIKVKLTDPTASIWDSSQSNISAAFLKTINTDPDQNNLVQGSIAYAPSALTIANDQITPTRRHHTLITEGAGPTDSIKQMLVASVSDGAEIILRLDTTGQTITFEVGQGGSGEIFSQDGSNIVLSDTAQSVQFQRRGQAWYQIAAASSAVLGAAYAEHTGLLTITSQIPMDNTKPQITEGTQVLTVDYQAKSATSKLQFLVNVVMDFETSQRATIAAFRVGTSDALRAVPQSAETTGRPEPGTLSFRTDSVDTTNHTYTVRVGPYSSGTLYINGVGATAIYDGVCVSSITIVEYAS